MHDNSIPYNHPEVVRSPQYITSAVIADNYNSLIPKCDCPTISDKISLPNHFFKPWDRLSHTVSVVALKSLVELVVQH